MAVISPQMRLALDTLLVKVCSDQWGFISSVMQASPNSFEQYDSEMNRIKSWAEDLSEGEKPLRRELLVARRDIEEKAQASFKPSRELDDYAIHTVPYLGSAPPAQLKAPAPPASKQGWLFLRTITGKPVRTHWVRRWFFVKNGIFGCLVHGARTGGVEESEKIGVLLCGVRPAFQDDRRFCFEVKTKDNSILLQAETQGELLEWIQAFETAKKKAIEGPAATEMLASSNNPSADAAFAVSPAISPELAAKGVDGQITTITEDPQATLLSADSDGSPNLQARNSFDVTASRRPEGEGERTRDHAARILEKLDIHKKSTASPQLTGGVQSSHSSSAMSSILSMTNTTGNTISNTSASSQIFYSPSLAPITLATPPVQTHLSRAALKVGVDRGVDLGAVDSAGGVPSSLMANQWGSANYGYISRLERGEVEKKLPSQSPSPGRRSSDPTEAVELPQILQSGQALEKASSVVTPQAPPSSPGLHRKTVSTESTAIQRSNTAFTDYPDFYPGLLKAHDAQLRMLFPNVPHQERLVMVFRASWNPDTGHSLPGRVFVTQRELFFYSHHMGMVVVHGASLESLAEVSYEAAEDGHNYLYLHTREDLPSGEDEGIMLKTFLDWPLLLQQRLNYLIQSNESDEPDNLEVTLQKLVKIETNLRTKYPQGQLDDSSGGRVSRRRMPTSKGTRVRVDRTLGGDAAIGAENGEVARFKLPSQPVKYTPLDIAVCATQKVFEVSAKALLHVIFGDKSAVCPIIYQQRGSEAITQHPWVKTDEQGHFRRQFDYQVKALDSFGRPKTVSVIDIQAIDVASDHLCYMITETKVPWHLPRPRDFTLITKVVITHEAKSRSKLSVYTKVNWLRSPWIGKSMIQSQAVDDMNIDALNMMDIVTEQVQRLGPGCSTRRVVEIYGAIGQQSEAAQIKSPANAGRPLRTAVHKRTLLGLILETGRSIVVSAASTCVMAALGAVQFTLKAISAHTILVAVLALSLTFSFYTLTDHASTFWRERHTARYATRLGIVPNTAMSRSIYLSDVVEAIMPPALAVTDSIGQCSQTFQHMANQTSLDDVTAIVPVSRLPLSSGQSSTRRLQRARQRLGTYRHDIMVALRLINRIEQETVKAEYESWLLSENKMCLQVRMLLNDTATKKSDEQARAPENESDILGSGLSQDHIDQLSHWLAEYCESCRLESEYLRLGQAVS